MDCPKCGSHINSGDIVCPNCRYPVAMMSGNVTNVTPDVVFAQTEEVAPPMPPFEGPIEVNKIDDRMSETIVMPQVTNNINEEYKNGEGAKAITSVKFLIPIFAGVIALGLVSFGIITFIKTIIIDNKVDNNIVLDDSYQLEFNNYVFDIPSDMQAKKDDTSKTLYLYDQNATYEISIQTLNYTYQGARTNKTTIMGYFQTLGYITSDMLENAYNNTAFLTLDATKKDKKYLLAITKAGDSSKCFGISILSDDNLNINHLEEIIPILKNAKYQKSSENDTDLDFNFNAIK